MKCKVCEELLEYEARYCSIICAEKDGYFD